MGVVTTRPGAGLSPPGPAGVTVNFTIDRWSTDQEREALLGTLVEQGAEEAHDVLRRFEPVGRYNVVGRVGEVIRYGRQSMVDGTRRILLVTDRPVHIFEEMGSMRTTAYDVSIVELRVDETGVGEGAAAAAVRVSFDEEERAIELKTYSSEPVRLLNVRRLN
jgi:hypothetical protein